VGIATKADEGNATPRSATAFCKLAFLNLKDAKLSEPIAWDGFAGWQVGWVGQKVTRFAAASWITDVLIERYGALVGYMQIGPSLSTIASVPLVEAGQGPPGKQPQ
jgi:hypothetical protein